MENGEIFKFGILPFHDRYDILLFTRHSIITSLLK